MLTRRIRRFTFEVDALFNNFRGKGGTLMPHYTINEIPEDAVVLSLQTDPIYPTTIHVYVHSETFDEVAEGAPIPERHLTVSVFYCEDMLKKLYGPTELWPRSTPTGLEGTLDVGPPNTCDAPGDGHYHGTYESNEHPCYEDCPESTRT